jgi:hypothetical protein
LNKRPDEQNPMEKSGCPKNFIDKDDLQGIGKAQKEEDEYNKSEQQYPS